MGMVMPGVNYDWHCDPNQTTVDVELQGVKMVSGGEAHFELAADGSVWQHNIPEHSLDGTGWVLVNGPQALAERVANYLSDTFQVPNQVQLLDGSSEVAPAPPVAPVEASDFTEPITSTDLPQ